MNHQPPCNIEAEQAVIGSIILNNSALPRVRGIISASSFYREAHGYIYDAIEDLYDQDKEIDFITLPQRLREKGLLEKSGGQEYIDSLGDCVSTSAGVVYHAEIVAELAARRALLLLCAVTTENLLRGPDPFEDVFSEHKGAIRALAPESKQDYSNRKLYTDLYDELGTKKEGYEAGYSTGIGNVDDHFYMEPGYIHCVCAESNIGKSPIMIQIADHVADRYGRTLYFTLESTRKKLAERIYARRTHIHLSRLHHRNIGDDIDRLGTANNHLINSRLILIDDSKYNYIEDLVNFVETEALREPIKFIVVDFLQYQYSREKQHSRHHEISYILNKYKLLAKDFNVPLLYASQLDKSMQKRMDHERRPKVGDLKESGDIQTMTDNILGLYAPDKISGFNNSPIYPVEVFTLKSKDQQAFSTWLNFNGHFQEFTDGKKPEKPAPTPKQRKQE